MSKHSPHPLHHPQQQIVDLQLQNKDQQNKLDEIDSCFELRELATRLDRVIVKDLLAAVGPLELVTQKR